MTSWISLITSLPTENATARMRAWRALKASGAAVLRDGVYLMPERDACRSTLESIASDILAAGGTALLIGVAPPADTRFEDLFDRSADYAALLGDISQARLMLSQANAQDTVKLARKLGKTFTALSDIDFFPGEARRQAQESLAELEAAALQTLSPDEPSPASTVIERRLAKDYQGKTWATRKRPWVDRLASAWLIRRHIDSKAKFLWLDSPADCPPQALGFDFDGATFTHVGARVTFEVLLASFGLDSPALARLGGLVHYLDVGGVQPPEAVGIESALAGLRANLHRDDPLLDVACAIFDGLVTRFQEEQATNPELPS